MTVPESEIIRITEPMNEGIVTIFESRTQASNPEALEAAWDFIKVCVCYIPPPSVVNEIIFKIMLKCNIQVVQDASSFLEDFLIMLPDEHRKNYKFGDALQDKSGTFPDLWSTFSYFVLSALKSHNVPVSKPNNCSMDFVPLPTVEYILGFYTNVLTIDDNLNMLFEDEFDERFKVILTWLNLSYKHNVRKNSSTFEALHKFVDTAVNTRVMLPSVQVAVNSLQLSDMADAFFYNCKDVYTNNGNLNQFLFYSNSVCLRLKICQKRLHDLFYKTTLPPEKEMTLESIVQEYLLCKQPNNSSKDGNRDTAASKVPSIVKSTGGSILHKHAREKHFGDLLEVLLTDKKIDINSRDRADRTALHEAALSNCYKSSQFLLEEGGDRQIDFGATDKDGRTALHCAAHSNSVEIVKLLLKRGGNNLADCKDNFNLRPADYARSEELQLLLRERQSFSISAEAESGEEAARLPLQSKDEYETLFTILPLMLKLYLETYRVNDREAKAATRMGSHVKRECCHYVGEDNLLCVQDVKFRRILPQAFQSCMIRLRKESTDAGVDISSNLLTLNFFQMSL